ncbi:MAG: TetR family transcriptional regulator [Acidobacteriota bacterium]|nr:TetR family transcriptional regulator [Acidobacteriota bacterium]
MQKRPRRATARSKAQKRRILEAASAVFRRYGLHRAGMRDIAAELDMHVGNLYYYFENKAELLAYCQEETLADLLSTGRQIASLDAPADEKLRRLIAAHVVSLNETIRGSLAHLEIEAVADDRRAEIVRRRDAYERIWRRVIREGIAAGTLTKVDPKVATMSLLGSVNWTVKWFQAGGRRSAAHIGREFADMLVGGLAVREAS